MKYLGIDYGGKRIGLAVSDGSGMIAFPRETIQNSPQAISELAAIVANERIERVVIGDTRSYSGLANPVTAELERFVEDLKKSLSIPVETASEAGTSIEASRYAEKGNEHRDEAAAAIILQRFLDMHASA